jgi:hypothetical protein
MAIIKQRQDLALAKNVLDYFINAWEQVNDPIELIFGVSECRDTDAIQAWRAHGYYVEEARGVGNRAVHFVGVKGDRVRVYAGFWGTFDKEMPAETATVSMEFSAQDFRVAGHFITQMFTVPVLQEFDAGPFRLRRN